MEKLFEKYLENQCTPQEAERVLAWLEAEEYSSEQKEMIERLFEGDPGKNHLADEELKSKLQKKFSITVQKIEEGEKRGGRLIKFNWLRNVAAAILITIIGGATWFWLQSKTKSNTIAINQKGQTHKEIAPGGNKAILTLADGKEIILDEANNGNLTEQGNTKVIKLDGQLMYDDNGKTKDVVYNSITTPVGGQYQLVLADGSKVWLNSASSLRFPISFPGKERIVELTGEGYFEVAKNASQPFFVKVNDLQVAVLGTHFNINSYNDEEAIKTTLLEGKVKLSYHSSVQFLTPGQQAHTDKAGELKVANNIDVDQVVAWKNGLFNFNDADLQTVMRQLARWYGVEVSFEGKLTPREFGGEIQRNLNLSQVLKLLETNGVHFRVEGKKLVVTP